MLTDLASDPSARRAAWLVFATAAALNLLSCLQYPYIDEHFILINIVQFIDEKTIIPLHFGYPTLVSYLGVLPSMVGHAALRSAGIIQSYADLIPLHHSGSYLALLPVRLVSALFGTLTVLVTMRIGMRLFGVGAGIAAGLLLALSPMQVIYAGRALGDITSAFFATLCVSFAFRARDPFDRRRLLLSAFLAGVAAAAKYSGGFAIVATAAVWVEQLVKSRRLSPLVPVGVLLPVAAVVGLLVACPGWLIEPDSYWRGLRNEMVRMSTGHRGIASVPLAGPILHWLSAERLMLVLLVAGSAHLLLKRRAAETILLAFIVIAFVGVGRYPKADAHYLLFVTPAICLAGGSLVADLVRFCARRFPRLTPQLAGTTLAAALVLSRTPLLYGLATEDSRLKMKTWLVEHVRPGQKVLMDPEYTPTTDSQQFEVARLDLATSQDPAYQYVVISSWWYERYTENYGSSLVSVPEEFADISRFYVNLIQERPKGWTRLAEFATGNGPRVSVLKRRPS